MSSISSDIVDQYHGPETLSPPFRQLLCLRCNCSFAEVEMLCASSRLSFEGSIGLSETVLLKFEGWGSRIALHWLPTRAWEICL